MMNLTMVTIANTLILLKISSSQAFSFKERYYYLLSITIINNTMSYFKLYNKAYIKKQIF